MFWMESLKNNDSYQIDRKVSCFRNIRTHREIKLSESFKILRVGFS